MQHMAQWARSRKDEETTLLTEAAL